MDFNTFDTRMRRFEQSLDRTMPVGIYIVARLDGHGFTRLTKKEWNLEKPFDERFHKAMVATLGHLMECGFRIIYGYTQSDEISILFHKADNSFGRKERKLISLLASEASVSFSLSVGKSAIFDCRLVPLPSADSVADYFRWRQEDCLRNSLNSHCYWALRNKGVAADVAQGQISDLTNAEKCHLLLSYGICFNELPLWQRRGMGIYYKAEEREGFNPVTKETTKCERRILFQDENLPTGEVYSCLIHSIIDNSEIGSLEK